MAVRKRSFITAIMLAEAEQQFEATQQSAQIFVEFEHRTFKGMWNKDRRVVAKAEHINGKSNHGSS